MDAIRRRFGSVFEWGAVAVFLLATFLVGWLIVRELRTVTTASLSGPVESAGPAVPAGVPPRAISVPVLLLLDGKQIKVGDKADQVGALLGQRAETGTPQVDRGALGRRTTRFYEHAGTRFILVFEPFERNGEPRVAAIYIQ